MTFEISADDLPRTTTRKLKRFEIERAFAPGRSSSGTDSTSPQRASKTVDPAWSEQPHVRAILEALPAEARAAGPESNLELDVGLDSMERVELLATLESRLAVRVPAEAAQQIHTLRELAAALDRYGTGDVVASDFEPTVGGDPWGRLLQDSPEQDPAVEAVRTQRPVLQALLFVGAKAIYALSWLLVGLRVSGRNNLPTDGAFIISPNHQSFLDAFLLASTLPYRVFARSFYVGASEYFSTPTMAWIARMIRVVPIDPDANLVRAMQAGALGLRAGKALILFPEGERSITPEVKAFKKGAAILSLNLGVPIVPVAIDGVYELWPRGQWPRFRKLLPFSGTRTHVRFGEALMAPGGEPAEAPDRYVGQTQRLRDAVSALLAELRGGRTLDAEGPY